MANLKTHLHKQLKVDPNKEAYFDVYYSPLAPRNVHQIKDTSNKLLDMIVIPKQRITQLLWEVYGRRWS